MEREVGVAEDECGSDVGVRMEKPGDWGESRWGVRESVGVVKECCEVQGVIRGVGSRSNGDEASLLSLLWPFGEIRDLPCLCVGVRLPSFCLGDCAADDFSECCVDSASFTSLVLLLLAVDGFISSHSLLIDPKPLIRRSSSSSGSE